MNGAGLLLLILVLGTLLRYWLFFIAILASVAIWIIGYKAGGWFYRGAEARTVARETIAARADKQNRQVLAGDPRGTYGEYPPTPM